MAHRKSSYRPLRFERLEARQMMAGDVTAAIINGDLVITGDAASNGLDMLLMSNNEWEIRGIAGAAPGSADTTINGQDTFYFDNDLVTGDVRINLGGGADKVLFSTGSFTAELSVNRDLFIDTGDGNDVVHLSHAVVADDLLIDTGAGSDRVILSSGFAGLAYNDLPGVDNDHNDLTIRTGAGSDYVETFFFGVMGNTIIDTAAPEGSTAADDDSLLLDSLFTMGNFGLRTGAGDDSAILQTATGRNSMSIDMGSGNDYLEIQAEYLEDALLTEGNLAVEMGDGKDTFVEGKYKVGGKKLILDTNAPSKAYGRDTYFFALGK